MTDFSAPTKTRNVSGRQTCEDCVDGWVELGGTITRNGSETTRGWAPCKACELGVKRYLRATEPDPRNPHHRPWDPETRFNQATDIIPHNRPKGPTQRDVQRARAQLKIVPDVESEVVGEDPAFEQRRRAAEAALREGDS